ncbi:MAG: hypothetical protein AAGF24_08235 [Cyanobacteria bacterium P01_H01_bin.121]
MQTTDIMPSPALDPVKGNWDFVEAWIDPLLSPPYLLLLLGNSDENCWICDPAEQYRVVFTGQTYDETQMWLLEDEYEPIEGRLLASEL